LGKGFSHQDLLQLQTKLFTDPEPKGISKFAVTGLKHQLGLHHTVQEEEVHEELLRLGADHLGAASVFEAELHQGWCRLKGVIHTRVSVNKIAEQAHASPQGWHGIKANLGLPHDTNPREVIKALKAVAAERFDAMPDDVEIQKGWCRLRGWTGSRAIPVAEIAEGAKHAKAGWVHVKGQLGIHPRAGHEELIARLCEVGSDRFGVPPQHLEVDRGWVSVKKQHRRPPTATAAAAGGAAGNPEMVSSRPDRVMVDDLAAHASQTDAGWSQVKQHLGLPHATSHEAVEEEVKRAAAVHFGTSADEISVTKGFASVKKNMLQTMSVNEVGEKAAWSKVKAALGVGQDSHDGDVQAKVAGLAADQFGVEASRVDVKEDGWVHTKIKISDLENKVNQVVRGDNLAQVSAVF